MRDIQELNVQIPKKIRDKLLEKTKVLLERTPKRKRISQEALYVGLSQFSSECGIINNSDFSIRIIKLLSVTFKRAERFDKIKLIDELEFELNHYHV